MFFKITKIVTKVVPVTNRSIVGDLYLAFITVRLRYQCTVARYKKPSNYYHVSLTLTGNSL